MRRAIAIGLVLGACGDAGPPRLVAHRAGELVEGLGCGPDGCTAACAAAGCDDGRRAGLVVVDSDQPLTAARAALVGSDVPVTVEVLGARTAGDVVRTAIAVRIPVAVGLTARTYPLALTVVGAGGEATLTLDAVGLPELVIADGPAPADGRYASIVLPTAIAARLTGVAPLRLEATGDITLAGAVDLGGDAIGPGPGGCAGAAPSTTASPCGPGGGLGALTVYGGSGGYGTAGADSGDGPGTGGMITGNPTAVPLGASAILADDNRGHGGGAHGDSRGGHGGGAAYLGTAGKVAVGQYAQVTARGSAPGQGSSAQEGGGGSGGALILAAGAGFAISPASTAALDATGTRGGGDGRIRVDGPGPLPAATPAPWLGPRWVDAPLVLADGAALTLAVDPRATAPLAVAIDGSVIATCTPVAGACTITPALAPGVTRLCVLARADADPTLPENRACIDVARL
ncbi:MAG: hypothetical protein JNK64_02955 [Myxococcales bacterium]|nr:hypothetical protein [Myxococcales bacterium]